MTRREALDWFLLRVGAQSFYALNSVGRLNVCTKYRHGTLKESYVF